MNEQDIINNLSNVDWRLRHLYRIIDKQSQKIVFKPNNIQEIIFASKAKRKMILKARQFGVTTGEVVRLFDKTIFNKNMTCVIMAHERDAIKKIFRIVRRLYKFMHPDLRPEISKGGGSQYEMFFPSINSLIYCDLESRGDTINHLHVSEAAFIDPEKIASTLQAVPLDGYVTFESTPNGLGNHFYDMWIGSENLEKLFFPWYMFPPYQMDTVSKIVLTSEECAFIEKAKRFGVNVSNEQIAFRRFKKDEIMMNREEANLFPQEYPEDDHECFLFSGTPAMSAEKVQAMINKAKSPISDNDGLKIFEKQHPKKTYVVGVDTASGVGADYCVATLYCVEEMRQHAILRGKWEPFEFANRIVQMCKKYVKGANHPKLVVESNNHGHAVLLQLKHHCHYPNLYYHKDDKPGWLTDNVSRPIMINTFIDAVHNGHATIMDKNTLQECLSLVDNKGKIEATSGRHDDCVMASAIAITMATRAKSSIKAYSNISRSILM